MSEPPPLGAQIERVGRPLTANALLGLLAPDDASDSQKEQYNRASPANWPRFIGEIARGLALYDGFDGIRGNQWLADRGAEAGKRYHQLAKLLADDRLWINSSANVCTQLFAVELAVLAGRSLANDCGGRTPNYDAVDTFRSLLASGTSTGLPDGVDRDERLHSAIKFPFLAAP